MNEHELKMTVSGLQQITVEVFSTWQVLENAEESTS